MIITSQGFAVLENDQFISKWARESGRLDHDQSALTEILYYVKPGDTVIDVGGYIGDHAIAYARNVGSTGRVIVFEPNPIAFEVLKYNTQHLPQVEISDLALSFMGDKNNYVLDYNDENVGASYLKQRPKGTDFTTCIDALKLDRCNLIKFDIEGMEVNALRGAEETIKRCEPALVIEINRGALERNGHTPKMIFDFLNEMNYFYRNIYSGQKMEGEQFDIIAFKK